MPVEFFGKVTDVEQYKTFIFQESVEGEKIKAVTRQNTKVVGEELSKAEPD